MKPWSLFCTPVLLLAFFGAIPSEAASSRVLLLANPTLGSHVSEKDLILIGNFYGLTVDVLDVRNSPSDPTMFVDSDGNAYPMVGLSEYTLETMDTLRSQLLKQYVNNGGVAMVFDVSDNPLVGTHTVLRSLTDDHIQGAEYRSQPSKTTIVSSSFPQLTDVFTGVTLSSPDNPDSTYDQALNYEPDSTVFPIMNSVDSSRTQFSFFGSYSSGLGKVFVSSAYQRHWANRLYAYYSPRFASELLPAMMTIKLLYGGRAWHPSGRYANFTIDDRALADVPGTLDYGALLDEMKAHHFQTTIAYIPKNFINRQNTPAIEKMFVANPDYFSVVQHGDFHTPYEFFGYTSQDSEELCSTRQLCGYPPVSYAQQELLIVDGLTKLSLMEGSIGLQDSRTMVFPYGISPVATIRLLNKYDFNATVNGQLEPILSSPDTNWDGWMRPGNCDYGGFPLYYREQIIYPIDSAQDQSFRMFGLFNLFLGRPALYFSHILQIPLPGGFDWLADSLNALAVPPEWKSLDFITTHLYLSKSNDDGSDSVWVFSNKTVLTNATSYKKIIHVQKYDGDNYTLSEFLVNGSAKSYSVDGHDLYADLILAARTTSEIRFIHYAGSCDYSARQGDVHLDSSGIDVTIHNSGDSAGVCSAALVDSGSGTLFDVSSAFINGHDSGRVHFNIIPVSFRNVWVILNPLDIGPEVNRSDNSLRLSFLPDQEGLKVDDFEYADSPLNRGWDILTPAVTGTVGTVYDSVLNSHVMDIETSNGIQFGVEKMGSLWIRNSFSVNLNASGQFSFYVQCVDSASDSFFIQYTPDTGSTTASSQYVYCHIGSAYQDGSWRTLARNIDLDIASAGWPSRVERITGFVVRGSLRIDDIVVADDFTNPVLEAGWRLISVPKLASDYRLPALFPKAISRAYVFDNVGGYVAQDTLKNGFGYWIKFSAADTVSMVGGERLLDTINVSSGWNMIGALSVPIPSTSVIPVPPESLVTAFYGFDGGYSEAGLLEPMKAYWLMVSDTGKLVLSYFSVSKKQNAQVNDYQKLNLLSISDGPGDTRVLYFGGQLAGGSSQPGGQGSLLPLPPLPPKGVFDVRFATDRMVEMIGSEDSVDIPILVSSTVYPLNLQWEIKQSSVSSSLVVDEKATAVKGKGSLLVASPSSSIHLRLTGSQPTPKVFALEQNYPNPFNPSTVIRYQIPVTSRVQLKIYNLLGQEVRTLVDEVQESGYRAIEWNSAGLASGVYFYRLSATGIAGPRKSFSQVKKMLSIK